MTSRDINDLVRERIKLEGALRQIRSAANDLELDDTEKIQEIRAALLAVEKLIGSSGFSMLV